MVAVANAIEKIRQKYLKNRPEIPQHVIRQFAPHERRNGPTQRIAEGFRNHVMRAANGAGSRSDQLTRLHKAGERHELRLTELWRRGELRINGPDGIDLDDMQRRIAYFAGDRHPLGRSLRSLARGDWGGRVQEEIVSGVDDSQYTRYVDTVIRLGTLEMAGTVDVAPILSLIGGVQVGFGQETMASLPVLVDIRDELGEMAVNEETPFLGLGDPVEVRLPKRRKIKFAYAISREMAAGTNLNDAIRSVMAQGGQLLDRYWAPEIIQLLFDVWPSAADNVWAFELDGTKWRTYYQVQTTTGSTPYENLLYLDEDIVRRNYGWAVSVEDLFDNMQDFRTGDPVSPQQFQTVTTGRQQAINVMESLGGIRIGRAVGGPENETIEFDRTPRDGWAAQTFWSPWITKYLHDLYAVAQAGWTKAQRTQAIARSLVAGSPRDAFLVQTEWQREEMDLQSDWPTFNREIVWARKFMEKTGLGTKQPQMVVTLKGLPDGVSIPAADPSPIA